MLVLNLLGFQLVWWLLILYQDRYIPIALLLLVGHLFLVKEQRAEAFTMLTVGFLGVVVDSILTVSGVFVFPSSPDELMLLPVPYWLVVLWFAFAATLRHSMRYLQKHMVLAMLFGGIGGALSYFAGVKFGAVEFGYNTPVTLFTLFVVWSVLLASALQFTAYITLWLSKKNSAIQE